MARIKFSSSLDEFNGSIQGQTFYSGTNISTIKNIAQMPKKHMPAQKLMSSYLIAADRHWKNINPEDRQNWIDFAAIYPQRTTRSSNKFLSGYALFVKRNQHFQIYNQAPINFLDSPNFTQVYEDFPDVIILTLQSTLLIFLNYPLSTANLDCIIGLSKTNSKGIKYIGSNHRLVFKSTNNSEILDISQQYISIFGKIPYLGENINFSLLQMGSLNGQYFFYPSHVITVLPTVFPSPGEFQLGINISGSLSTWSIMTNDIIQYYQIFTNPIGRLINVSVFVSSSGVPACNLSMEIWSFLNGHENTLIATSTNSFNFPDPFLIELTFNFDPINIQGLLIFKLKVTQALLFDHDNFLNFDANSDGEYKFGNVFYYEDSTQIRMPNWSFIGSFLTS